MCGGSGGFHGPLSQEPAPKTPTGSLGVCGPQPQPRLHRTHCRLYPEEAEARAGLGTRQPLPSPQSRIETPAALLTCGIFLTDAARGVGSRNSHCRDEAELCA